MATTREKYANREGGIEPFFPQHILHMGIVVSMALCVFFVLVFFLPWIFLGAEEPANPEVTPQHIKPEWYFLAAYQGLKLISSNYLDVQKYVKIVSNELVGITLQGLIVTLIFLLPFWERSKPKPLRKRPVFLALLTLGVVAFIGLTLWGKLS